MRVGVIDVGSNTVRLLVAAQEKSGLTAVCEERAQVGLARDIERTGFISDVKIRLAADRAEEFAARALQAGAGHVEVLVTAPGRQSGNGDELVRRIGAATGLPVRALSAEDEGRLAFAGVAASLPEMPASLAVCDVGGGSTQLMVGTGSGGPVWLRSLDFGSLRLTQRHFTGDPPRKSERAALAAEVEATFAGLAPPLPRVAVATGGTARAVRRIVGRTLGPKQLEKARARLVGSSAAEIVEKYGLQPWRGETLLAGLMVLAEAQRRLTVPLVVARAGLREGAALQLVEAAAAA